MSEDEIAIDALIQRFFHLFSVPEGSRANLSSIHSIFIPEGTIIKSLGDSQEVYDLQRFIEPREKLFDSGSLRDFKETELHAETHVVGSMAHRLSTYRKTGVSNGIPFETHGVKSFQLVRTSDGWRISSLVWEDEHAGFTIPEIT